MYVNSAVSVYRGLSTVSPLRGRGVEPCISALLCFMACIVFLLSWIGHLFARIIFKSPVEKLQHLIMTPILMKIVLDVDELIYLNEWPDS